MKRVDGRLEEIESRINEEARRLDRLHPLDAKHNVDVLEHDLRQTEDNINTLFSDVQTLKDGRYPQASDLHKRLVCCCKKRLVCCCKKKLLYNLLQCTGY